MRRGWCRRPRDADAAAAEASHLVDRSPVAHLNFLSTWIMRITAMSERADAVAELGGITVEGALDRVACEDVWGRCTPKGAAALHRVTVSGKEGRDSAMGKGRRHRGWAGSPWTQCAPLRT